MAVFYWKDLSLLFGARAIAVQTKSFAMDASCEVLDTTPLSTTGYSECIGGKKTVTLTFDIMADFTATATEGTTTVYPQKTVSDYLINTGTQGLEARSIVLGSTVGSTAYLGDSLFTSYTPVEGEPGGLAMGKLACTYSGVVARGQLAHPANTARGSSAAGTAIQLGAVSATQRLYAALHVANASGTAADQTLIVKIQSDDNSSFTSATDRITFTTASGLTEQITSVAGAITDDYWRAQWTIAGAGTESFLFGVTFGVA